MLYLCWPIPGHANKVGEVMANRICLVSLPLRGRIDELDTIANPEELKAYLLDVVEDDTLKGFELNCLMYQPLGLHGTYKVEGIDRLGDGQGYGGAEFTVEVTKAMSMFDIMGLVWSWVEVHVWPHIHHVYFESVDVYHLVWVEAEINDPRWAVATQVPQSSWQPIRVINFHMGS